MVSHLLHSIVELDDTTFASSTCCIAPLQAVIPSLDKQLLASRQTDQDSECSCCSVTWAAP
jgi:hypothetical protein